MTGDMLAGLTEAGRTGVAVVPAAVPAAVLDRLLDELAGLAYAAPPRGAQPVADACDLCVLTDPLDGVPAIRALRDDLADRTRAAGGFPGWQPNEVFVRRYAAGSTGMVPHRDAVRFWHLVATLTVHGSATFDHVDDDGRILGSWRLGPGDLLLLRGTEPGDRGLDRPRHAVSGPAGGDRSSVAFRHHGRTRPAQFRSARA